MPNVGLKLRPSFAPSTNTVYLYSRLNGLVVKLNGESLENAKKLSFYEYICIYRINVKEHDKNTKTWTIQR